MSDWPPIMNGITPIQAAQLKVIDLFLEIRESIGDANARWIFSQFSEPPQGRKLQEIEDCRLIDRLDHMPGGPNVNELARQIARETITNPNEGQIEAIDRRINRLNAKRKDNPFWPQRDGG